jgi:Pericentrin-AKAP-450 domain of centrosomal targeting protein
MNFPFHSPSTNTQTDENHSNQADLRMLSQLGVTPKRGDYAERVAVRQRFRAAVFVVVAAKRMERLERGWRGVRRLGVRVEGVRRRVAAGVGVGREER